MAQQNAVLEKLLIRKENKERVQITRKVAKGTLKITNGYILDLSDDLVLIHESDDFKIDGYSIIPFDQIKNARFNKSDKYFDMMLKSELIADKAGIDYKIDLNNWKSAFRSLQAHNKNVIVECQHPEIDSFTIGPIEKVKSQHLEVLNFDVEGYLDDEPTTIDYASITYVAFDREYINVFSKYLRTRDNKK
ncbi:hypothetical protein IM792_10625 [Mucilaginibacter sp. JRF]|uniref:hypothetical protein n=1 Tax=Mucilaginibacter sp. JRF TaxID=2780088 RepID=UPI00187FF2BE|nr:hypothetical protein [Mucilaginibacter sp. JRF]MBE9584902.1 hypothetical protein [Mucilaginibacter sp. JRF]